MLSPVLNGLQYSRGVLFDFAQVPWQSGFTAATAAAAFAGATNAGSLGSAMGTEFDWGAGHALIEPDNSLGPTDVFINKLEPKFGITILEVPLANLAMALGSPSTAVSTAGGSPVTQSYGMGDPSVQQYWTLRLALPNQAIKVGSNTYTQRLLYIFKAMQIPGPKLKAGKKDHFELKLNYQIVRDTTVTAVLSGTAGTVFVDQYGFILDQVTASP